MAIKFSFNKAGDILEVTTSGFDESLEEVNTYGYEVIMEAIKSDCKQVLCNELNLEYRLGTIDLYQSGKFIAENAPGLGKVAIVTTKNQLPEIKFWENVVNNRGLMVKVFSEIQEAKNWLAAK
jgi:hypothetical protein